MKLRSSGERDRFIQIVPQAQSAGSSGFPVETDGSAIEVWASMDPAGGRERFSSDHLSAPFDTRWQVPYSTAMDPVLAAVPKAFAVLYEGRRHDIVAAHQVGRRRAVELLTLARMG